MSLPPMLKTAISVMLETGRIGPEAERQAAYRQYQQHIQLLKVGGVKDQITVLPIDEYLPPAWWTEEAVDEAEAERLEAAFDAQD